MIGGLHCVDVFIIAAYLAVLAGIGIYFSRSQTRLEDFFLARRSVSWIPVGLSLMAALNSGIDYLAQPSATIKFGLVILVVNSSWFLLYPYVFFITLPLYRRLGVYTAYEYLERRFDLRVRALGAAIFLLWRLSWMATALYVPCLAISSAIGRPDLLIPMLIVLGSLVTLYTMLGGIQAVIWTDVTQFFVMFTGLAVTVAIASMNVPGGVAEIVQSVGKLGAADSSPPVSGVEGPLAGILYFIVTPVTALGLFLGAMVSRLGTYTTDQVMIQRFQTTRSIREARQGFVITAISDALWMTVLAAVGVALFAYYQHHPLPDAVARNPDQIFPSFMATVFPHGAIGLVIAAILAASLSSTDSAINSMTSVVVMDFYHRIWRNRDRGGEPLDGLEARHQIRVARLATLLIGVLGTILGCNVDRLGTVYEIANKLINGFTGPLFGIFLLGMCTRRANALGVLVGGMAGTAATLYTIHLSNRGVVSFVWPSPFGFLVTVVVGYALSVVSGGAPADKQRWTFRQITSRTPQDTLSEQVDQSS
jgi:SSS family transporter